MKSKVVIDQLFSTGKVITKPPFRLVYLKISDSDFVGTQTLISVPKRRFKLAVSRNSIKRKISEAFRLNSIELNEILNKSNTHLAIGFIYIGSKKIDFVETQNKMQSVLEKLQCKLKLNENEQ